MLNDKFLYGALGGALLTLAGLAVAQKNPEKESDAVKPLIVLPGSAPRYTGPQGREADITELLATGAQTGGKLGIFRQTIAPGSGPPTHLHHVEVEFAYVVSGHFTFKAGESVVNVPVGTFIVVPPNTVHTFKNTGASLGSYFSGCCPAALRRCSPSDRVWTQTLTRS